MSFSDYMDSLGATQRQFRQDTVQLPLTQAQKAVVQSGASEQGWTPRNRSYALGQNVGPLQGQARGYRKDGFKAYGGGTATGYVDSSGGFLGYGNSIGSLQNNQQLNNQYNDYQINDPQRKADLEATNIANQQARFQYEQDFQAAQAAKLAAQQAQPSFASSGLTGLMGQQQAPQQSSMGRGSGFAPGQQYAGGMGRGSGAGLLGGMGRGGGQ